MKYTEAILGTSEFTLRLPNIIAFVLYLTFVFLLLKKESIVLIIPLFILITFNPFLMDFFGLARGYGLSICLMIISIYYLIRSFSSDSNNTKSLIIFNFTALLASLANFTLINFYFASFITYNLIWAINYHLDDNLRRYTNTFIRLNRINLISIFLSCIILFEPIRRLAKYNTLNYGGDTILDTLKSQIYNTFYNVPVTGTMRDFLTYFILLSLFFNFFITAKKLISKNKSFFSIFQGLTIINLITIIVLLETIVQHYLFNYDYLKDRFALFIYPLVTLNIAYSIIYIYKLKSRISLVIVCYSGAILLTINLSNNLNFYSYKDWKFDANSKKMLIELEKYTRDTNITQPISLGVDWIFEPTINFYRKTKRLDWIKPVSREKSNSENDFVYILANNANEVEEKIVYSEDLIGSPKKTILYLNK
ncbi:hypothetical protein [uncultured Sunxiuqinia sp.]|uniref:hypothetical protein n=1 Tax=uncultured Sunxiuqinia sp. TaxID=1573825 RepID=UPI002AA8DDCF|nr:hypothetical protein [uncultured Sunxiuqinia sp.]